MPLRIGIVGLPNAGKSTLFNALTQANAAVASYPFTTIEPHVGVAEVPDPRLEAIASLIKPDKVVPTTIQFVDIAGLVKGAHRGEGLGNQFLAHIREVDAIALVLRCFENPDVAHMSTRLDPTEDLEVLDLELSLADLGTVERRIERTQAASKAHPKDFEHELAALDLLREHLAQGRPARAFPAAGAKVDTSGRAQPLVAELFLLTNKPRLLVANVGEEALPDGGPMAAQVIETAAREGSQAVVLCADCESALVEWPPDEAAAYRAELGLSAPGLERLVQASYQLLNLITFFTITGGEVVRAWTLHRGESAWHAAGQVHTDMQQGFIRADVVRHADLLAAGSMAATREAGRLRSEGRDYLVQDGDVIHIHFSARA
ncbi:MAG: redox-regulated ATPase YchF [Anaerolineales bacterium]|nr:MAG: redox-regulated ATPase YchF [Anaerolineales bacterium]